MNVLSNTNSSAIRPTAILKKKLQENKSHHIFWKIDIFSCTCGYQGVRNVRFLEIWRAVFCYLRFENRLLALLLTNQTLENSDQEKTQPY